MLNKRQMMGHADQDMYDGTCQQVTGWWDRSTSVVLTLAQLEQNAYLVERVSCALRVESQEHKI